MTRALSIAATLAGALALIAGTAGCSKDAGAAAPEGGGSSGGTALDVRLNGSGASFPAPIYSAWFKEFSSTNTRGIRVEYQSKGSSGGIKDFIAGTVDFAASDAAMKDEEIAKVAKGVQMLPMTAGEVVCAYNLPGAPKGLKLPRDVYPQIFLGKVSNWNDAKIQAANPGMSLPDLPIKVVVRADGSGTTYVFSQHLSAISPEWKDSIGTGKSLNWPDSDAFIKAPKNDGVTAQINQIPGAIGYIEYGFATSAKLNMAALQNKSGNYVMPGLEGGQATLASAKMPENLRAWVTDPEGAQAYPVATFTWMLFYKKYDDPKKAEALRAMVEWCVNEGQKDADKLGYIPLPAPVQKVVLEASKNIQ